MGPYDNETGEFVEDAEVYENGLWLVANPDSTIKTDAHRLDFWIIPNGIAEIEGSDFAMFLQGPNRNKRVIDVLSEICQAAPDSDDNPRTWDVNWESLGLTTVPDGLKRWTPEEGYYIA